MFQILDPLVFQTKGIVSLLRNINRKKASGPDGISCWVLKEAADEIAPFLRFIFNQQVKSQVTGNVPMWPQCLKKAVRKKPATRDQYLSRLCPGRSWSTLSSIILWVTWTRIMYLSTTSIDSSQRHLIRPRTNVSPRNWITKESVDNWSNG